MTQHVKKLLRFWVPIILGCAFLIIVPTSASTTPQGSAAQSAPSPVTSSQAEKQEQPNPVRRFFSWMKDAVRRPFRKRVLPISDPPNVHITSSTSLLNFCPLWMVSSENCPVSREVELFASAGGPDVDEKLLFTWTVTAGRLRGRGEGQKVIWDLSSVSDGTHTANVEVNDGAGLTANDSTRVTVALCNSCVTGILPCPTVSVSCPEQAKSNQSMTFGAHVDGGDPAIKATYKWSVSAGKISSGQGTSMITVDVSEVTRESITATVSIGGYDPRCTLTTASCMTLTAGGVVKPGCQPF